MLYLIISGRWPLLIKSLWRWLLFIEIIDSFWRSLLLGSLRRLVVNSILGLDVLQMPLRLPIEVIQLWTCLRKQFFIFKLALLNVNLLVLRRAYLAGWSLLVIILRGLVEDLSLFLLFIIYLTCCSFVLSNYFLLDHSLLRWKIKIIIELHIKKFFSFDLRWIFLPVIFKFLAIIIII